VSRQSSRSNLGAADGPDEARGNKVVPEVEETAQSRSISKIIKVRARRSPARSLGAIKIVVRSTPRAATSAVLVDRPRERAVRLSDPASLPADARVPGGPRGALPRRDEDTVAAAARPPPPPRARPARCPSQTLPLKSCYVFTLENPIRRRLIRVVYSKSFDRVIMLTIMLNCVFLAMDSNAPDFDETDRGCVARARRGDRPARRNSPTRARRTRPSAARCRRKNRSIDRRSIEFPPLVRLRRR
jgi:hypothetical protein